MKKFNATLPPVSKYGMKLIQKKTLTEKEKDFERSAHKIILASTMVLDVVEDIFIPESEEVARTQRDLLIKLCEDAVSCTSGTESIKFKFNSTNYLQALGQETENMFKVYFEDSPLVYAFVMINVYFISLHDRQRKVLERVVDENGEYIYEFLKYLQYAIGNKYSFNDTVEFSKKITALILINYKSMYADQ